MINKELDKITIEDLEELIENSVPEGKSIDYKEKISLLKDNERKEFLYDVSSFSNASGGDLIYGIKEDKETGYPKEIIGIKIENTDKLKLQLDSIIRDSISPRLTGINYNLIQLKDDYYVLIIRISKSWNKPHQVIFKGTDKFYSRGNNGKYKLDVFELRNAFIASDSLKQSISKFRNERLADIVSNEGAAPLLDNGKIILQIVPFISFETGNIIDLLEINHKKDLLRPLGNQGFSTRYNFDGILSYENQGVNKPSFSYLQLFKNGIIETVDSWIIQPFREGKKQLYIENIEEFIIDFIHRVPEIYKVINIEPPFVILLTMTGVSDYELGLHGRFFSFDEKKVGKEILTFPDILIEDWNSLDNLIKPWFDSLWNSVGIEESKSFIDGKWTKRR